jgi:hypothetical protein
MRRLPLALLLALPLLLVAIPSARAADVDGPDCNRPITDFGDAPEGFLFISPPFGPIMGHFPTCLTPGAPGDQQFFCAPRSTPPGATGYMRNIQDGTSNYWLGCFQDVNGLSGIDSDADGKVSTPPGPSACSGIATDGTLVTPFQSYGQDESESDGDAGVHDPHLYSCVPFWLFYSTANCGPTRTAYLNVLVDFNMDGDWNDNFSCDAVFPLTGCVHEWAVKNVPVTLGPGCEEHQTPGINAGPFEGYSWMRISLTDDPVDDDFPWAGSANRPDGSYHGGETEDYFVWVLYPDATRTTTWGRLKTLYR